jgi:hypothetical protein
MLGTSLPASAAADHTAPTEATVKNISADIAECDQPEYRSAHT